MEISNRENWITKVNYSKFAKGALGAIAVGLTGTAINPIDKSTLIAEFLSN